LRRSISRLQRNWKSFPNIVEQESFKFTGLSMIARRDERFPLLKRFKYFLEGEEIKGCFQFILVALKV
jgi:hypothetical protein